MQSLNAFIRKSNVHLVHCDAWHTNPHMRDSLNMNHWRCELRLGTRQLTLYFSKGYGHKGAPARLPELLGCLASDAASIENTSSFEDWASDLGFDPDSRSAERTYSACFSQSAQLRRFLGDDLYNELLYETERE